MSSTNQSTELPLIDLGPYLDPTSKQEDKDRVVAEVREACEKYGFFQVRRHGVSMAAQKGLFRALENFFSLPHEEKMKLSFLKNPGRKGYECSGMSHRTGDKLPDAKEAFYIGREEPVIEPPGFHCPNRWPDDQIPSPSDFRDPVWAYYQEAGNLGRTIWEILIRGFLSSQTGQNADEWAEKIMSSFTTRPIVQMKMIRYPAFSETEASQFGVGPHTDFGGVTVLLQQPGKEGLEVLAAAATSPNDGNEGGGGEEEEEERWLPVPSVEDVYVVNCGDMIQRWSGGRFRSAKHRVINRTAAKGEDQGERYSCALFWHGDVGATNPLNPEDPDRETIGQLLYKRFGSQFSLPKETFAAA